MDFITWLQEVKHMGKKSATDVQSRLNRALGIINQKTVSVETLDKIAKNDEFNSLSVSVKSQLRRSIRLYLEYKNAEKIR